MTTLREAAQMALDALTYIYTETTADEDKLIHSSIEALRTALANEFNPDWDAMAVMVEEQQRMAQALENCRLLAARHRKEEWAQHILRFCEEGGATANTLRAALAAKEPEPVAWTDAPTKIYLQVCEEINCDQPFDSHIEVSWCQEKINDSDILYVRADTAPPQREFIGLTDEEIWNTDGYEETRILYRFARAIEVKLKEKNT